MDVRGKLVELIRKGARGHTLMPTESIANYLVEHGVTIQEWIPVSERLPELNTDVLVCDAKYGYFGVWSLGRYKNKDALYWEDDGGWFKSLDDVTHWMPLPEPPKGGGADG